MGISFTKPVDLIIAEMEERFGSRAICVFIGFKDTTPQRMPQNPHGRAANARNAVQNIIVARVQAKKGRKFFFLGEGRIAACQGMWKKAIDDFLAGNKDAIAKGAVDVKNYIIEQYKYNLEQEQGEQGRFAELEPKYKAIKENRYGKDKNLPIMEASGQLKISIVGEIKKL